MEKYNNIEELKNSVKNLPEMPGVYLFLDKNETIIYVGKAKNLKKRVSNYFSKNHDSGKTRILVSKIFSLNHIVVETETDALLLENNLIKKYKPRYNILLKDDKTYPWICIKNEDFPRVFQTRNVFNDGSKYYGPYTSIFLVRTILNLLRNLFPLRTCKLNLSPENIIKGNYKVCLEYHINNCTGPCVSNQTSEEYNNYIEQIHNILKGNFSSVFDFLQKSMSSFAKNLEFEKANEIKNKIEILKSYKSKSTVAGSIKGNIDVFSIADDSKTVFVNYLRVVDGSVIQIHTIEFKKKLDEDIVDVLPLAIVEILHSKVSGFSNAKEILVPFSIDYPDEKVKITIPQKGDKMSLLELSKKNLKYYILEQNKRKDLIDPERHKNRILLQMQKDLRLQELPVHIECFDNSNIQGTNPVASCVVFKNAKPSKKDYRKFIVKTVEGPDDFASMREILYRRYKRLSDENLELPKLIIIDGGKGQLSSAVESLKALNLYGKIAIIGIAKKLEEIFFPEDSIPIYLDKNSETLKVIQHARNEAHRFGITFHRDLRSKNFLKSELEQIPGVGEKTIEKLLQNFKSVKKISEKNINELSQILGEAKAKQIFDYFKQNLT
jgi:excinuclease ABC subunit C